LCAMIGFSNSEVSGALGPVSGVLLLVGFFSS
jgi:hypothetical protein